MAQSIDFNSTILMHKQEKYPNLRELTYASVEGGILYYGDEAIKLNGYGLSRIDEIFFQLPSNDIFNYIKNACYDDSNPSEYVSMLFTRTVLTEENINFLQNFVIRWFDIYQIYQNNLAFFQANYSNYSIRDFIHKLKTNGEVINKAIISNSNYPAVQIIKEAYNQKKQENNSPGKEKAITLNRKNPKNPNTIFEENVTYFEELKNKDNRLGVAGFTSIILVITATIALGIFLALKIIA